jgi:hypothetical protein
MGEIMDRRGFMKAATTLLANAALLVFTLQEAPAERI